MITSRNIRFFKKARAAAELSDFDRINIGCIAVYKNKVIGVGYNTYKTHPKQKHYDGYRRMIQSSNVSHMHAMHAELMCLNSIKNDENIQWNKVELYIYRKRIISEMGLSRPCDACMQMIKDYGIKNIYYTTSESFAYEYLLDVC